MERKTQHYQFWRVYNIRKAIYNIVKAWNEDAPTTMISLWRKLWPKSIHGFVGFVAADADVVLPVERLHLEITTLAQDAGFHDMDKENVKELLTSRGEDFPNEDLIELEQ